MINTKEYREKIAEAFIKSLDETPKEWKQQWTAFSESPRNPVNGTVYRGINRLWLSYMQRVLQTEDPRWCTFKQAKEKGWHIRKGEKASVIERWNPYDKDQKKTLTWNEYYEREDKENLTIYAKYFYVFNGSQIEGIPELEKPEEKDINPADILDKISKSMGVEIAHDGGNSAFYRITEDKIHLPKKEYFHDDYAYNATALHELSHATGHASRLNRYLGGGFGSEYYAYEELVAELSSCFMSLHLPTEMSDEHFENHKQYVESWISGIKQKPEVLIKAMKDAEKAADYLELHAGEIDEHIYKSRSTKAFEVSKDKVENYSEAEPVFHHNSKKEYVKEYLQGWIASYDFENPLAIKTRLLPSTIMEKEIEQGGMRASIEECRKWIQNDPEAAYNTRFYIQDKFPEEAGSLNPVKDPKRFSLIMMERELYKMLCKAQFFDENWDKEITIGRAEINEICKENKIGIPKNAKLQKMKVAGFELE
ncbi:ArdC family protein [Emergencia sp. 1XD21-10]|uniref:ArdC family protein n=1 Tax=Emergencia sp. 1XD21-10 TaxID=2304569 RepID=UPI00137A4FEB|nr:zincin-like metallopeptidase domain-containing protein [Emergencia sp. 1XD21-10]NCE98186.1 DUF1738 domain-containing protein [Emergencia sp. 1XD21-10]